MPHVEVPPYFRFGVSYTRELINRIGPFPEDLEFAEDVVVNWRALCAGVSIALAPEVVTLHYYPTSCRAMLADQFRRGRLRAGVPATSLWRYELVGRALASVLFLVGISTHFPLRGVRIGLLALGAALLVFAAVQILQLPFPR